MRSLEQLKLEQDDLKRRLRKVNEEIDKLQSDAFKSQHGWGVGDVIEYQNGSTARIQRMRVTKIKYGNSWWADGKSVKKDGTEGRNRAWTYQSYGEPKLIET
jgi:hypothetical protein